MTFTRLCIIAALSTMTLAGCLVGEPADWATINVQRGDRLEFGGPNGCGQLSAPHCTQQGDRITIRDVRFNGEDSFFGSVRFNASVGHVSLENIEASSVRVGLIPGDCADCGITGRNLRAQESCGAFNVRPGAAPVVLEHLVIRPVGNSPDRPICTGYGLWVDSGTGLVTVKDVSISLAGGTGDVALLWVFTVDDAGMRPGRLHNVSIDGFPVGVDGRLGGLEIDGLRVTGCAVGLMARTGPGILRASNVTISSCDPPREPRCDEPITPRADDPLFWWQCEPVGMNLYMESYLTDVTMRDVVLGIFAETFDAVEVTRFRIENTEYGFRTDIPYTQSSIKLHNGLIANATYSGAETRTLHLDVSNVTFRDNGHGWPDNRRTDYLTSPLRDQAFWYGGLIARVAYGGPAPAPLVPTDDNVVRNSQFIGNVPFGLSTPDYRVVDAAGNWWNSPLGPSPPGVPASAGTGDAVSDGVQYQPFLAQRP